MATVAIAVVVAGSLAVGCGSGGGKKRRGGGGSHSSSSSSGGGSSSYGSTTGGSSYSTPTPTAPASSTSPSTGGFDFSDVSPLLDKAYADVPACGTGKWTDADLATRVPKSHRAKIVVMRSYDCYANAGDTKPQIAKLGAFITFADASSAAGYLRDVEALGGVSGFIVSNRNVVTVGNPAGLKNPRSILDQVNLACRRCGTITAI